VISGFLITTLLFKELKNNGRVSLKNFYIRRALRIIPVAWLFLIALFFLNIFFKLHIPEKGFFTCLFFLANLPINGAWNMKISHFWTLAVEEQFYLFFPVMVIWNKHFTKVLMVVLFITIPFLAYFGFNKIGVFYSNKIIHNITFVILTLFGRGTVFILIGCLLSIFLFEGVIKNLPTNKYLSFVVLIVAIACRLQNSPLFIRYFSDEIFCVLISFVIILNINSDNYLSKILDSKILVKLGVLSYSIYMWQPLFTHGQPWAHLFKYSNSLLFNIPALFIVSYLSYQLYEKKFLILKKKFV
jgi:peptidoglycan/LPS O-acetylase OafA/YrhL